VGTVWRRLWTSPCRRLSPRCTGFGTVPVAVPLDHDPAVHDVLPFVVQVVPADA
jgi:hypothetical protein